MPSNWVPLGLPRAFLWPSGDNSEEIGEVEEMPPQQNKAFTWETSEIINVPKFKFGSFFGVFLKL